MKTFFGAAGALASIGLLACAPGVSDSEPAPDFSAGQTYHYEGEISLEPETGGLVADWSIFVNQADGDAFSFLLNENISSVSVSGDDVERVLVAPGEGALGGFTQVDVTLQPADGRIRRFEMSYGGVLFDPADQSGINSISPDRVELTVDSFWMPFDARFSQRLTAELDIAAPGDWAVAVSTGEARLTEAGAWINNTAPQLDIAITMLTSARVSVAQGHQIIDTRPGERDVSELSQAAGFCTEHLNARYGAREPLPDASLVIHNRTESGYSRGTLIALTDVPDTVDDASLMFICHEFAHFWSQNGNAGGVENWLNESFAEYVSLIALREARGEAGASAMLARFQDQLDRAGAQPPIWSPQVTERRPYLVNYRKGPLALAALETRLGRELFAEFLRRYMVDRVATTPDLLDMLEDVAGAGHRAWFEAELAE